MKLYQQTVQAVITMAAFSSSSAGRIGKPKADNAEVGSTIGLSNMESFLRVGKRHLKGRPRRTARKLDKKSKSKKSSKSYSSSPESPSSDSQTVIEIVNTEDNLLILKTLLEDSNPSYQLPDDSFILLAPTDDAFLEFFDAGDNECNAQSVSLALKNSFLLTGNPLDWGMEPDDITKVLSLQAAAKPTLDNHVILESNFNPTGAKTATFTAESQNGDNLIFGEIESKGTVQGEALELMGSDAFSQADILKTIMAENGMVHIINEVIAPKNYLSILANIEYESDGGD